MTEGQWDKVVEIQAQIDRERDELGNKDRHPTPLGYSNTIIASLAPNAILK